jgi:hypothetical protein
VQISALADKSAFNRSMPKHNLRVWLR